MAMLMALLRERRSGKISDLCVCVCVCVCDICFRDSFVELKMERLDCDFCMCV